MQYEVADEDERIKDVRGYEQLFSLDTHGFQVVARKRNWDSSSWDDADAIEQGYLPEVERLLRVLLQGQGVTEIRMFDWRVRLASLTPFTTAYTRMTRSLSKLFDASYDKVNDPPRPARTRRLT